MQGLRSQFKKLILVGYDGLGGWSESWQEFDEGLER